MRRQTPIANLLYSHLFPNPTPNDPPSFAAHLARNLVPEVRIEVATFYGDLNSAEARYPGLNYYHPPHRMRLGRFKHHQRLFAAFDTLGLTYNEIQDFCCWEGTKWARERYEKDEGVKVVDTTGDEIGPFVDRRRDVAGEENDSISSRRRSITRKTDISIIVEEVGESSSSSSSSSNRSSQAARQPPPPPTLARHDEETLSEEESPLDTDTELDEAINRTMSAVAALDRSRSERAAMQHPFFNRRILYAWEHGQSLTPELEQYLKEQCERGNIASDHPLGRYLASRRSSSTSSSSSQRYTLAELAEFLSTSTSRAAA